MRDRWRPVSIVYYYLEARSKKRTVARSAQSWWIGTNKRARKRDIKNLEKLDVRECLATAGSCFTNRSHWSGIRINHRIFLSLSLSPFYLTIYNVDFISFYSFLLFFYSFPSSSAFCVWNCMDNSLSSSFGMSRTPFSFFPPVCPSIFFHVSRCLARFFSLFHAGKR